VCEHRQPAQLLKVKTLERLLRHAGIRYERDRRRIKELTRILDTNDSGDARITELKGEIGRLQARLDESERWADEVAVKLERSGRDKGRAETRVDILSGELDALRRELDALTEDRNETARKNAEQEATIARLKRDMTELADGEGADVDERVGQLKVAIEELTAERDHAEGQRRAAEAERQAAQERAEQFEREHEAMRAEAESLRADADRTPGLLTRVTELEARLAESEMTAQKATEELSNRSHRLGKTEAELAHAHEELTHLRDAVENAKDEVARLEAELGDASAKAAELDRLQQQLDDIRRDRDGLQAKLREAEDRVLLLEKIEEDHKHATQRLREAEAQISHLSEEIHSAAGPRTDSDDTVATSALQAQLDGERAARRDLEETIDDLRSEAREAKARAEHAERDLARTREDMEGLEAKATMAQTFEIESREAKARLEESQHQVRELTQDVSELSKRLAEVEADKAQHEREIDRLRALVDGEYADSETEQLPVRRRARDEETFIPELIDDEVSADDDVLMDSLLRFIKPDMD